MAVSRFSVDSSSVDRAVDRASLLSQSSGETLAVMPAPEDLLSDADRDRIVALQPLQTDLPLTPGGITLIGTRRNDVLRGTPFSDRLEGLAGNDRLFGEDSVDVLLGGGGDDRLFGGSGDDQLFGDEGRDRMSGNGGNDQMFGGSGSDTLRGDAGDDLLEGGFARDSLLGGNDNDELFGQGARDFLLGGRGDDVLVGGPQEDRMGGGVGRDRFVYNSFGDSGEDGDTIVDFDRRRDVLDLRRLFRGDNFSSSDRFRDYVIVVREEEDVTIIRVDADGNSGDRPFITLATLENVEFDDIKQSNFLI